MRPKLWQSAPLQGKTRSVLAPAIAAVSKMPASLITTKPSSNYVLNGKPDVVISDV